MEMLWGLLLFCSFARFWYEIGYNRGLRHAAERAERMLDEMNRVRPGTPPGSAPHSQRIRRLK